MYRTLSIIAAIFVSITTSAHAFNTPSLSLERFPVFDYTKHVGLDLCPACINEAVEAINVILNVILDEGIMADCGKLCDAVANKTGSQLVGTICNLACDAVGIDEFIRLIIKADIDPIWYCEMARLCPINDNGDGKFVKFGVSPSTAPEGATFVIDCSYKTLNGTGTGMLRLDITDPRNETDSNDFLIDTKAAGTYPERIGLKTSGYLVGTYNVTAQLCYGECGSHHPHSAIYDVGKASFTITKKK